MSHRLATAGLVQWGTGVPCGFARGGCLNVEIDQSVQGQFAGGGRIFGCGERAGVFTEKIMKGVPLGRLFLNEVGVKE